jgi:hypothetical protein
MYPIDYDEFKQALSDLCVSVNRPFTDDLARVFWEDLRKLNLSDIKQRAAYLRGSGKRNFTSNDLRPEEITKPVSTYEPPPACTRVQRFANNVLWSFLAPHLKADGQSVSNAVMQKLIAAKNQIVALAKDDEPDGELREVLMRAFERVMAQT